MYPIASRAGSRSVPALGAASRARIRSSVVLPDPFGPVTSRNPKSGTSRSRPRKTLLSPKRFASPRATITAGTPRRRRDETRRAALRRRTCRRSPRARRRTATLSPPPWPPRAAAGPPRCVRPKPRRPCSGSQDVREHEHEERDRDDPVHREEGSIEPPEVAGTHERVLVEEEPPDDDHAEPVRRADVEPDADGAEEHERREMQRARACERPTLAEARRPRVQALVAVDLDVEQRVEQVEPGDPCGDRRPERPCLPRERPLDRNPCADGREAVDGAEPEVAQPREP